MWLRDGGLPEGRIVEVFGPPSIGKSHIATQIARTTQKMGGIVVYIDTENATSNVIFNPLLCKNI